MTAIDSCIARVTVLIEFSGIAIELDIVHKWAFEYESCVCGLDLGADIE